MPSTFTRRRAADRMEAKSRARLVKQIRAVRQMTSRVEATASAMRPGGKGRAFIVRVEPPKSPAESARVWIDEY